LIAFRSNRDCNHEIYTMNVDGSGQTRLTNDPSEDDTPAWSPDGKQIAFTSGRDGSREESEVYVMDADGSKIAYHSKPLLFAIFLMNATGSDPVNLTDVRTSTDVHPAWSPDGAKIAFTSTRDGNSEIYVMNADGTGVVNLTNHPETDFFPSWSADSKKLAFVSQRDGNREIYVMNADGSKQTRL
ncbi:MAG TPA: hypothetical protein DCM17_11045, partial [Dehalococcoidia bacterium]|nr:hypothetical protein [Dehalococcoidia bacterium]